MTQDSPSMRGVENLDSLSLLQYIDDLNQLSPLVQRGGVGRATQRDQSACC